jgi:hypothetical protein
MVNRLEGLRGEHCPPSTISFHNQIPVRFDGNPQGPLGAIASWRGVHDFEHSTLCRVFGLDPIRFWFDLPSTVRGVGSMSGAHADARRIINGYVMMAGLDEPVGKLTIVRDGDKFKDVDPRDKREFFDLSHH